MPQHEHYEIGERERCLRPRRPKNVTIVDILKILLGFESNDVMTMPMYSAWPRAQGPQHSVHGQRRGMQRCRRQRLSAAPRVSPGLLCAENHGPCSLDAPILVMLAAVRRCARLPGCTRYPAHLI